MQLHFYRKDDFFYEFLTLKLTSLGKRFFELGQTCSESQKVKSSQSHDFDFLFLPKNFIFKIKIEHPKIFRIVKLVVS